MEKPDDIVAPALPTEAKAWSINLARHITTHFDQLRELERSDDSYQSGVFREYLNDMLAMQIESSVLGIRIELSRQFSSSGPTTYIPPAYLSGK